MAALSLNRIGDLFVVTAAGLFEVEDARAVFERVAPQLPVGAAACVLIDLRHTQRQISYANMYRLLDDVRRDPNAPMVRVASLNRWDNQFEGSQFFEASGKHIGLQVRAFTSEAAALDWLLPGAAEGTLARATAVVRQAAAEAEAAQRAEAEAQAAAEGPDVDDAA